MLHDIPISGVTIAEHNARLKEVLARLSDEGPRVNKDKGKIGVRSVTYLGHTVTPAGISPLPDYTDAIKKAPRPTNKKELMAISGKNNFYDRFLQNRPPILAPLYELLQKDVQWDWTPWCETAYGQIKKLLISDKVLMHYNLELRLVMMGMRGRKD